MVCCPDDVDLKRVSEVRGQRAPVEQTAADQCRERRTARPKLKKKTDNSAMNISSSYSGDQFTRQSVSGLQK